VVDTLERLGRAEEITELRRKLFTDHGVLVVAADNNFADPTGVVGKAVGMVEQIRSTENTRVSRHNVIRGKKDAARLKRWPGGPPPFGFKLKPVVDESASPPEVYNVLEPEPRAAAALRLAFERAAETGEGDLRLAQWWNENPEVPADFKPISPFTMGYRLESPIAIGTLRWGKNRTGVVNDTRVVEPNPDGAELVPDFCPALVSVELYERVQRLRRARGEQIRAARRDRDEGAGPAKLIAPQARGLTLKYLLTGLVRCGSCNASMRPVPSGRQSKAGKRYVYYTCPRHYDKACANGRHVPEAPLREAVISRLRARLFPPPEQEGRAPAWLPELTELVRRELRRFRDEAPGRRQAAEQELGQIEQRLAGWAQTLGNPHLPGLVRAEIEGLFAEARRRQEELRQSVTADQAASRHLDEVLGPGQVLAQLRRLGEVLAGHNPTLGNLELSRHVDVITCHSDGRVELRGTCVGLFAGAVELLGRDDRPPPPPEGAAGQGAGFGPVTPRRRGRLRVPDLAAAGQDGLGEVDTALSPERFAGLAGPLFWTEPLVLAEAPSWAEAHAAEVAQARAGGLALAALAAHFGKSVPTIRAALRHARATGQAPAGLPGKVARRRWEEDHAAEVARARAEGKTLKELAALFGKSEPTIRKALRYAAGDGPPPAGLDGPNDATPAPE
jgi:DNA invertase Pin-like site-specific DNA recombinase